MARRIGQPPTPSIIDTLGLPAAPEIKQSAVEAAAATAVARLRDGDAVQPDNGDKLYSLVEKALTTIEDILDMDQDVDDAEIKMKIVSAKKDAAMGIINAGLKADENRFRRENKDLIEKLFAKIQADKVKTISL